METGTTLNRSTARNRASHTAKTPNPVQGCFQAITPTLSMPQTGLHGVQFQVHLNPPAISSVSRAELISRATSFVHVRIWAWTTSEVTGEESSHR